MIIEPSYEATVAVINELLARWRSTPMRYPFNRPDAIIPQKIIPGWLRENKQIFANWYVAVCLHMKGRITSLDAFRGHIRVAKKYPEFYIPHRVRWHSDDTLIKILTECRLTSDHRNVIRDWRMNTMHLDTYYHGNAINLLKGLTSWEEAIRRIKNKRTKKERKEAGYAGEGLNGFQEKMVSMLLYFFDWEGWLDPRFPYPSPSDIQNIRAAIAGGALRIIDPDSTRRHDFFTAPWREMVLRYIRERNENPIDVADVLWLFGNLMCGNSPLTETRIDEGINGSGLFDEENLPHHLGVEKFLHPAYRRRLEETCLVCPFRKFCHLVIPAQPYYKKGIVDLRRRIKMEEHIDISQLSEPVYFDKASNLEFKFS